MSAVEEVASLPAMQPAYTAASPSVSTLTPGDTNQQQLMPASFAMAEPLNEAELTALIMASPLYQKLEQMKKTLAEGRVKLGHKPNPGNL